MSIKLTGFEAAIKNFLDGFAKEDKEFAANYAKPNKSISECCKYIINEVKKNRGKESCVACTDEEVYGMAIHYYDEDDIVVEESKVAAKVVAPSTTPAESKTKTRQPRKSKTAVETDMPEPLSIPMF